MAGPYPNLYRVRDGVPIWMRHANPGRVLASTRRITDRTNTVAYFDRVRNSVCFGYERDGVPILLDILVPLNRPSGADAGYDPVLDQYSEDDVVTLIQLGKVDPRLKAKWRQWRENSKQSTAKQDLGRMIEENKKDNERRLEKKYERYSMGRHYRGRALVSGIKAP